MPTDLLLDAAQEAWDDAVELGELLRRAQLPGVGAGADRHHRPADGLRHHRHRARPRPGEDEEARRRRHDVDRQPDDPPGAAPARLLATRRSTAIVAYIDEHKSILGAPDLAAEHLTVFACSMGDNTIHYLGHVKMMAAVQPFISGAISKTVNMPEDVTVEDVEQLHIDAWQMGLKAVAIYRDNCKVAQPLSTAKKDGAGVARPRPHDAELAEKVAELEQALANQTTVVVKQPIRERLPRHRRSPTFTLPGGRLRGLRHGRRVRRRPSRRAVHQGVEAGLDPRRHHGRLLDRDLARPAARRAAAHLRREVHQHALRAGGHDRRPRPADRHVAGRLHLPPPRGRLPAARRSAPSSASSPRRSASSPRCPASRRRPPRCRRSPTRRCRPHSRPR